MQNTATFEAIQRGERPYRFLDDCTYVISSNHVDQAIGEARYYGGFPIYCLDLTRVGSCVSLRIFILRVLYELHIPTQGVFVLWFANRDSDQGKELIKSQSNPRKATEDPWSATSSYLHAWV